MSTEPQDGEVENGLADKTLYSELTEKQQAVVDYTATNPDTAQIEAAEAISQDSDDYEGITVTQGYVGNVRRSYPHIIEEREHVINNQHATTERGNVTVEGEIDLSDPEQHPKPQTFDERPVKATECDHTIDDFLPEATCARLERIAEDISPDWLDRRASVEETVRALAQNHALPEDIGVADDG